MPDTSRFIAQRQTINNGLRTTDEKLRFQRQLQRVQSEGHFNLPGIHGGWENPGQKLYAKPLGRYMIDNKSQRVWALYSLDIHGYEHWQKFECLI